MALTDYNYDKKDSVFHAISEGYKRPTGDHWKVTGAAGGFGKYVDSNRWRTAVVTLGVFSVVALTAAYFMSPAYAAGIGAAGAKAAAFVSPAITGLATLAAANPFIAGLIMIAALATIVTLAYMVYSKSSQVSEVKGEILKVCEKDGDKKPLIKDGKLEFNDDTPTILNSIAVAVGLAPAPAQAK